VIGATVLEPSTFTVPAKSAAIVAGATKRPARIAVKHPQTNFLNIACILQKGI
jgi:hypothetical protein